MNKLQLTALLGCLAIGLYAETKEEDTVTLYQVGAKGKYCVSLTKDTSHCISGVDDSGNTINVLDFFKGKKVVFENLSDAPHDMKFTGANAEDVPAQEPNGSAVSKKMNQVDMDNQKITCSFHGDMLGVGYRVPDAPKGGVGGPQGHPADGRPRDMSNEDMSYGEEATAQNIRRTNLADVGKEVMAKGSPKEVANLIAARPELRDTLQQVRPLLAQELDKRAGAGMGAALASGLSKPPGDKTLSDGFFGGTAASGSADPRRLGAKGKAKAGGFGVGSSDSGTPMAEGLAQMDEALSSGRIDRGPASENGQARAGMGAPRSAKNDNQEDYMETKVGDLGVVKFRDLNGRRPVKEPEHANRSWWFLLLAAAAGYGIWRTASKRKQRGPRG